MTPDLVREYVFDVRTALDDDARAPRYIETVRGKGFRLIGDVTRAASGEPAADGRTEAIQEVRATVAVLRPQSAEGDTRWTQFAEWVARQIIDELACYHDIAVIAQQASFAAKPDEDPREVAARLGANYLLASTLGVFDGTVRTSFQLIDGRTARQVWADRFNYSAGEMLRLSDRIATAVVAALVGWHGELHRAEFKLVSVRDTESLNAYEHFIRACDIDLKLDEANIRRSIFHLERSLELDPRFARCWVILSVMLRWAYDVLRENEPALLDRAGEAIERAYALDPSDPSTLALVALHWAKTGDIDGAQLAAVRAGNTCERDTDACTAAVTSLTVIVGDFDRARWLLNHAFEINKTPPGYYRIVEARIAFFIGDYRRSIAASMTGTEHVTGIAFRCLAQAMMGDNDAAASSYASLVERFPRFNYAEYADRFPILHPAARSLYDEGVERLRAIVPWVDARRRGDGDR